MAKVYCLTGEGRADFAKMRGNLSLTDTPGYRVLDCLFENGTATIKDITSKTRLLGSEVDSTIRSLSKQGMVKRLADL
jgi:DNA-binding MarR family transcriptional regulator